MPIPEQFRSLVELAGGDDWAYAAAVAQVESAWNPFAVGDLGRAWGLWQMHLDFIAWMFPERSADAAALEAHHGSAFHQAVAFRRFWGRTALSTPKVRLAIYHYGEKATAERISRMEEADPDGTVAKYLEAYAELTAAPKKTASQQAKA